MNARTRCVVSAAIACLVQAAFSACLPPPAGLVSWWPGEDSPHDYAGYNHGVFQAGASYVNARVGRGFNFTGSNYLQASTWGTYVGYGEFSIMGWARTSAIKPLSVIMAFEWDDPWLGFTGDGRLIVHPSGVQSMAGGFNDGQFHHFAVTRRDGVLHFFKDGVMVGSNVFHGYVARNRVLIGADGQASNAFQGVIDELTFFDRALSSNEIAAVVAASADGLCKPPAPTPTFFIEAEDFDFDGGQHQPVASSMPYLGGAYAGLSAVAGVDYFDPGANEYADYRPASQGVALLGSGDTYRDSYSVPATYRVGFCDGGDWFNYTRVFPMPARSYHIYARLSSGAASNAVQIDRVISGGGTSNQTLGFIGRAMGPPSGSWDYFVSVPVRDLAGNLATVTLGGPATLRLTILPGGNEDINYLQFVPAETPPTNNCLSSPAGLVAWWPGDGHAKDAHGASHGTLTNGATYARGKVADSFLFDGVNDYVDTALDTSPAAMPNTTWECWVFPSRVAWGRFQILSCDDGGYDRSLLVEGGMFGVFTGWGVWMPVGITPNEWQHVAVVYRTNNVEFYKNGVRFSFNAAPTGQQSVNRLQIGRNPGFGEFFQGQIDEVGIYNRALSEAEIKSIFTAGGAGRCKHNNVCPAIAVSPATLPQGEGGAGFSQIFSAGGGSAPYTFSSSGNLPPSLSLSSNGLLSGLLVSTGSFAFSIRATDANGCSTARDYLMTVAPRTPPCTNLPVGLVSWWRGEDNAEDAIGFNSTAELHGTTFAAGKVGQAFRFDGQTNYLAVPTNGLNVGTGDFTLEGWLQVTGPLHDYNGIFSYNFYNPALYLRASGHLHFFPAPVTPLGGFNDGQLHHFAVVRQGGEMRYYKDGVAGATNTFTGTLNQPVVYIGTTPYGGENFPGLIDELSFYNRALSASEVAAIVSAGSQGKCGSTPTNAAVPNLTLSTTNLDFGNVIVGTNATRTLTISNSGTATLVVSTGTFNNARFSVTNGSFPISIAAGSQNTLSVFFTPNTAGGQTGLLALASNDPDESQRHVLLTGLGTSNAPAGSNLVADYQFQNSLASSVPGAPLLTNLGANTFVTTTVDSASRSVLRFDYNDGLLLSPLSNLLSGGVCSIVILFSMEDVAGYSRLLDFKNGSVESGLYVHNGALAFWPAAEGSETTVASNVFVQVTLTRRSDGLVTGYVDGSPQFAFSDAASRAVFDGVGTIRLFRDDGSEASAGRIARLRLYNSALTAAEVAALDRIPIGSGLAGPEAPPTGAAPETVLAAASGPPAEPAFSSFSGGTTNATFDHHVVTVRASGFCDSQQFNVTNRFNQANLNVPLNFSIPGCGGIAFAGSLNLDFPVVSPPATVSSFNVIRFDPRLAVNASASGTWTLGNPPPNNKWFIDSSLSIDATDEVPGCPSDEQRTAQGLSAGGHAVSVVNNCTTRSITFPAREGNDLLYLITTSLTLDVFAPSNPPGTRVLFIISVDVHSVYRVSAAPQLIRLNPEELSFTVVNSDPMPATVLLENDGQTNLNFEVTTTTDDGGNWLGVSPASGILGPHGFTNLTVGVIRSALSDNVTNTGTVWFYGNAVNSPRAVKVQVTRATQLIGLEAVQVVQDWHNSVPLVSNKYTMVRAHLRPFSDGPVRVSGVLRGYRNGVELPESPLPPANTGGFAMAHTNAAALRHDANASLYFYLPMTWTTGTVSVLAEVPGMSCSEAASPANDCAAQLTFVPAARPSVNFVRVKWYREDGTEVVATMAQAQELASRLFHGYPIDNLHWYSTEMTWTNHGPPRLEELLPKLEYQRLLDRCRRGCNTIYYGFLNGSEGGGLGYVPGVASVGWLDAPFGFGRHRHAHELGHNLNRRHATLAALGTNENHRVHGFCAESAPAGTPDFPFFATIGANSVATLGPMLSGDNYMVYGYDAHASLLVDPFRTHELMSYCGGQTIWRWPSSHTYTSLLARINSVFTAPAAAPFLAQAKAEQSYLVLRGSINLANHQATLAPFGQVSSSDPPAMPAPGPYLLRTYAANGALLTEVPFAPDPMEPDSPQPHTSQASFLIAVPQNPAIRRVSVFHGGQQIATKAASANPPQVTVQFPNGGQNITGNPVTFQWTAQDPDGDSLSYVVQYSDDNGTSWTTLAVDWSGQSYQPSFSTLARTQQGRIRVIASDGFLTASDESDAVFSVANHPPEISLHSPAPQELFAGKQQVIGRVSAYDVEDGPLPDGNIEWRSSRDGLLGTGSQRTFANLTEGAHRITVRATDSYGETAESSVNIVVAPTVPARIADLVISQETLGPVSLGMPLTFEITIENRGPSAATDLVITDRLPATLRDVTVLSTPGACTISNLLLRCTIPHLPAGASAVLRVQGTPSTADSLANLVDVKGAEMEPAPENNLAFTSFTVSPEPRPRLEIQRSATTLVFTWPATASGYLLESSSTVPNPGPWASHGAGSVVNGRYRLELPQSGGTRFYRLRRL